MALIIFFCIGILTLPTNMAQIIPFLKRKFPAPVGIYICSLTVNIGLSFIIAGIEAYETDNMNRVIEYALYFVVGFILYGIGVIFSFVNVCYCSDGFDDQDELDDELKTHFDDYVTFKRKLAENRSLPPRISVIGEAYHYEEETTYYYDADGNLMRRTDRVKKTTYENRIELLYKSWQEEGNSITLPENESLIHGRIMAYFNIDNEAIEILNRFREEAYNDAKLHDTYAYSYNHYCVPEMHHIVNGTTKKDGSVPCIAEWIPTMNGRVVIGILKFFGYSTLIYNSWSSKGKNMFMKVVKNVSMKPTNNGGLRCNYMEDDPFAGKTTFHKNKAKHINVKNRKLDDNLSNISETAINIVECYNKAISENI